MSETDTNGYHHNLKVKAFDIDAGKLVAIVHEKDAKELGIFTGERLEL